MQSNTFTALLTKRLEAEESLVGTCCNDKDLTGAMTAARHFLPPSHCSLLVDAGDDFSPRFRAELEGLGEGMTWFRHREGKTTRALNIYSGSKIGQVD